MMPAYVRLSHHSFKPRQADDCHTGARLGRITLKAIVTTKIDETINKKKSEASSGRCVDGKAVAMAANPFSASCRGSRGVHVTQAKMGGMRK
jgi:hypothetical protein